MDINFLCMDVNNNLIAFKQNWRFSLVQLEDGKKLPCHISTRHSSHLQGNKLLTTIFQAILHNIIISGAHSQSYYGDVLFPNV